MRVIPEDLALLNASLDQDDENEYGIVNNTIDVNIFRSYGDSLLNAQIRASSGHGTTTWDRYSRTPSPCDPTGKPSQPSFFSEGDYELYLRSSQ